MNDLETINVQQNYCSAMRSNLGRHAVGVKTEVLVRETGARSVPTCVPHPTSRAQSRRLAIGCEPTISW
jgi:hypothetical protein